MQATRGAPLADPPAGRKRPLGLLFSVAVAVVVADQVSKALVVARMTPGRPVDVIVSFLRLDLTRNSGAAFSLGAGAGATVLFSVVAVAVVVVILRTARRLSSRRWAVCLALLLGGALGNLADRLFRAPGPLRGHVVDWIQLPHWPVFNVADSAITVGAVIAILLSLLGVALWHRPSGEATDPVRPPAAGVGSSAGGAGERDGERP